MAGRPLRRARMNIDWRSAYKSILRLHDHPKTEPALKAVALAQMEKLEAQHGFNREAMRIEVAAESGPSQTSEALRRSREAAQREYERRQREQEEARLREEARHREAEARYREELRRKREEEERKRRERIEWETRFPWPDGKQWGWWQTSIRNAYGPSSSGHPGYGMRYKDVDTGLAVESYPADPDDGSSEYVIVLILPLSLGGTEGDRIPLYRGLLRVRAIQVVRTILENLRWKKKIPAGGQQAAKNPAVRIDVYLQDRRVGGEDYWTTLNVEGLKGVVPLPKEYLDRNGTLILWEDDIDRFIYEVLDRKDQLEWRKGRSKVRGHGNIYFVDKGKLIKFVRSLRPLE